MAIRAKEQPKWYQLRWQLSNFFMKVARAIKPDNPEVTAFYMEQMHDFMIYGKTITRVSPMDMEETNEITPS